MTIPTLETIAAYLTIFVAVTGALLAAFWLSLVIWAFRDMRLRSRDPFAQILAALLVAALPFVGILIYLILRPPETLAERYERALEEEALLQEIEERPRCHKCSRMVSDEWAVCPSCQTELKKQCASCHSLLEMAWKRCPYCAAPQPAGQVPLVPALLAHRLRRGIPAAVSSAPVVITTAAAGTGRSQQRQYRSAEIGGPTPGTTAPIPGRMVVGESHPTVVQFADPSLPGEQAPLATYQRQALGGGEGGDEPTRVFMQPAPRPDKKNGKHA
jgi:RNA polymerase subunit RPABC4/transcription elongation factor Spt4